ncbi:MAG TPA: hypothetical protein V6C57_00795, partial [Coleofasciculaceae cyanobacterium]
AEFAAAKWQPIIYLDVVLQQEKGGYGIAFSKGKGEETAYTKKIENSPLVEPDSGIDVYLMLCAKVQLKRNKGGWQVLSSFPENLEPGVSPIFNHGKDPWTGNVRNANNSKTEKLLVPKWAPESQEID